MSADQANAKTALPPQSTPQSMIQQQCTCEEINIQKLSFRLIVDTILNLGLSVHAWAIVILSFSLTPFLHFYNIFIHPLVFEYMSSVLLLPSFSCHVGIEGLVAILSLLIFKIFFVQKVFFITSFLTPLPTPQLTNTITYLWLSCQPSFRKFGFMMPETRILASWTWLWERYELEIGWHTCACCY